MLLPLFIWLISFVSLALRLNFYPLSNWDEAWYAQIVKNMASGKYGFFLPFWNGQYYFDKPPLYFWLSAPIVHFFGPGEWQVRLVAVIAGSLAILLTYLIANYFFGKKAGVIAAIILLSLGQVWLRFSSADLDSLQIFLFLASIYFFLKSKQRLSNLFLSGFFLGLSLLVKSWLFGFFPFVFLFLYSFFADRSYRRFLAPILSLSLLIGGWWYLAGSIIVGKSFFGWYVLSPGAGNFRSVVNFLDPYFGKVALTDFGFWLVPLLALFLFKPKLKSLKFVSVSLAFGLIYFSALQFLSDKFAWYLLPLYPLLAICLGGLFSSVDLIKNKLFLSLIVLSFFGQNLAIYNSYRADQDRSQIGAGLGKFVSTRIATDQTIILDDNDFPTFIYYANFNRVLVSDKDGGKPNEPWIISYETLKSIRRPFRIVTRNWPNLNLGIPREIITAPEGYRLVRFDSLSPKP